MPNLVTTPLIEMVYEVHGRESGTPVVLLHGFPDDLRAGHFVPREAPEAVVQAIRDLEAAR